MEASSYSGKYAAKVAHSGERLDYFGPENVSVHVYNWAFWCFFVVTLIVFLIIGAILNDMTKCKNKDKFKDKKMQEQLKRVPLPLAGIVAFLAFIFVFWAAYRGYVSGGEWSGGLTVLYVIFLILFIIWAFLIRNCNVRGALFVNFLLLVATCIWVVALWGVDVVSAWLIAAVFLILLFLFACTLSLDDGKKKDAGRRRPRYSEDSEDCDPHSDRSDHDSEHSDRSDHSKRSDHSDGKYSGGGQSFDSRTNEVYGVSKRSHHSEKSKHSGKADSRTGSLY